MKRYMLQVCFVLSISLLSAQAAWAAPYSWRTAGVITYHPEDFRGYGSPGAACEAAIPYLMMYYKDYTFSTYDLRPTSASHVYCDITLRNKGNGAPRELHKSIFREGDECLQGTYNAYKMECTNDEEKGGPSDECGVSPFIGNPINFAIGNKFQQSVDYRGDSRSPLQFIRSYNSLDGLWRHNYSARLRGAGSDMSLELADGKTLYFTSGIYNPAKNKAVGTGRLEWSSSGWSYSSLSNEKLFFDTGGRLVGGINAESLSYSISYEGDLATVTDALGRSISFSQREDGQPLQLNSPGRAITYTYEGGRLVKISDASASDTGEQRYHYEDPRDPKLLTGITDERDVRYATWTYDDQGRAISSEHAGGAEKVLVNYNADGSSTVTNELGKKTTYRFQSFGGIKRIIAIEGEPSANCPNSNFTFAYDSRGLLTRKTDNKGHVTTYTYDSRGLETSRIEAYGTPQARTTTTRWHSKWFLPLTVTEPGRVIRYQYDDQGRSLGQTIESL